MEVDARSFTEYAAAVLSKAAGPTAEVTVAPMTELSIDLLDDEIRARSPLEISILFKQPPRAIP